LTTLDGAGLSGLEDDDFTDLSPIEIVCLGFFAMILDAV
jgi:hypothetical protein